MEDQEHLEFLDFMNQWELEAKVIEADKEIEEDINPIT